MANFRVIATKIDPESFEQISAISECAGVKNYNLIQTILDCVIKTLCKAEIPNRYASEILRSFADFSKVRGGFSFINPNILNIETASIIALADGRTTRKKSRILEPVLISKKEDGGFSVVTNGDRLLSVFLGCFSPAILHKLQKVKTQYKLNSLSDSLRFALDETLGDPDPISDEIKELFADNDRNEGGRKMADAPYRRTMNNDLDGYSERMERQQNRERSSMEEETEFDSTNGETIFETSIIEEVDNTDIYSEDREEYNPEEEEFDSGSIY